MLGEVISYNAEKAYGFIKVENDKNQYFFHINNLIDKNIKIDLNQKVEFELVYTDKGYVAKYIQFIQKIECPICNTENLEIDKNCKNEKCKFDLTYVKDGSFIGLSQNEIEAYNQKLQKTKNVYNKIYEDKMIGKIAFYFEEKGYGFISVANDKNQYFFHFRKIINKPENIKIGSDIEFGLIETSKGLNAKDIYFIEKIKCPICNTENLEIDKNCKNEKCKFDLTYVKDGSFIGSSQNEIEGYNEKLKYFRMNYFNKLHDSSQNIKKNSKEFLKIIKVNNNQKELNKIERGKIIKGKIIFYNKIKCWGFILGEDGNKYFFHVSNTDNPLDIRKDLMIMFVCCNNNKGLFAENITIIENSQFDDDSDDYDDYDDSDDYDDYDDSDDYDDYDPCSNLSLNYHNNSYADDYNNDHYGVEPSYENGWGIERKEFSQRYWGAACPTCADERSLWFYSNGYIYCESCGWWDYLKS